MTDKPFRQYGGTEQSNNGLGRAEKTKKLGITVHEFAASFVWQIPGRTVIYDADGNEIGAMPNPMKVTKP